MPKGYPTKLTEYDRELIGRCKAERTKLKRQLSQLTDDALAKKFSVTWATVKNIPEWTYD